MIRRKKIRLLSTCLFFVHFLLFSQQYNFKKYTTKNGLANSSINNIFQDSRGYVWFATQGGGISRFDGREFKNFTKKDGLVGNEVTCINEDNSGNLWISTSEGMSMFDRSVFINYTTKNGLSNDLVYSIYKDSKGVLWFSTFGGGITKYNGKEFSYLKKQDGLPSDEVFCVMEDKEHNYWIGTYRGGLCKYDGNKFHQLTKENGLTSNSVFCLSQDKKQDIWIGTTGGGTCILKHDNQKIIIPSVPESTRNDLIGSIVGDRRGNVWIGSEHGLVKYDGSRFHLFTEKEGLSANSVQALCQDTEGNIWIGMLSAGVCLFKSEAIVNYTEKDGLLKNNVLSIFQDSRGNMLFGTSSGGGVNSYEDGGMEVLKSIKEFSKSNILSIYEHKDGKIWVGMESEGLVIMEHKRNGYVLQKNVKKFNDVNLNITKIIGEKNGGIWLATYGKGIFKVNGENITQYTINNGLADDNVLTLYEDKKGVLWIGTTKSGVTKFDGKHFEILTRDSGLADNNINSICEDKVGRIYFGTYDGLTCYDGKRFTTISTTDGLCSNFISALCVDTANNIWIGTDKGINKIKVDEDFNISAIKYYGEQAGLRGIEVNTNAMFFDKENTLWVGTTGGLARYSMNFDYPNTTTPNVILTDIRLFYDRADWSQVIEQEVDPKTNLPLAPELPYKSNHLTFDFQALTTDNVKYSFILEGLDKDWSPPTTKTEAPYPNIPPGKEYTFKVKVMNSDGMWSNEAIVYNFTIKPPFYQTWWFNCLMAILVTSAFIGYTTYRTKKLEIEKRILENKVQARTQELKVANNQLSVAYGDIKDSIEYAKHIQEAILPLESKIKTAFPDSFILFKPRDIVSGDFYWFASVEKGGTPYHLIAAADCTGHGVPGAFMSMIGNTILNEIVITKEIIEPSDILNKLHQGIRTALKQKENESRDGMDIALCVYDSKNGKIKYAGANRPLWIIKNDNTFEEIKATKSAIGGATDENQKFEAHQIELNKGDRFYLSSDGYADQFGGQNGKKLMTKKFKEVLISLKDKSIPGQKDFLNSFIDDWKKNHEQVDDILVIGVKV